jgi:hypothetical protein
MAINRQFVRSAQISNTAKRVWDMFLDQYDGYATAAASNGTVAVPTTTQVAEYGNGIDRTTYLTLTNFAVGTSADNASLAIGALLYTFPAGAFVFESAHVDVGLTLADAVQTNTPELGLGSVIGSGANATLGAVGATCEEYFEGTATANVSGTHLVGTKFPTTAGIPIIVATGGVHALFLNVAVAWANLTAPSAVTANGNIVLKWQFMG